MLREEPDGKSWELHEWLMVDVVALLEWKGKARRKVKEERRIKRKEMRENPTKIQYNLRRNILRMCVVS